MLRIKNGNGTQFFLTQFAIKNGNGIDLLWKSGT
jgi:hypothetical protein